MKVSDLFIYPVKSGRGQQMKSLHISADGPDGDRQWMLVDDKGRFLSQRTLPKLATLEAFYSAEALTLGMGKMFFKISNQNHFQRHIAVQVWNDAFEAALEADLYSQGLSQYLGTSCRLVRYAPYSQRRVGQEDSRGHWQTEVRFADGRPLLLVNEASLADLNSRLASPISMNRFRANLVVSGAAAYEEDSWKRIQIGEVVFSQPKACTRCKMINIDQVTGEESSQEVLRTLASYRKVASGVTFGVLWIPENAGVIRLDDPIVIL